MATHIILTVSLQADVYDGTQRVVRRTGSKNITIQLDANVRDRLNDLCCGENYNDELEKVRQALKTYLKNQGQWGS